MRKDDSQYTCATRRAELHGTYFVPLRYRRSHGPMSRYTSFEFL